ncbi:MAG: CDP-alcohol phosphatidyltransferase family protein [Sedimentisphaerales bacterium]|nr:CDP-alcohol phosphatidyltransferase family protein [Sedimentisphaerales bacterium]
MLKLIPNILTLGRLVLTIVFLVMILLSPPYYTDGNVPFPGFLDIAFIIFVIAGLTDIGDGLAARRLNVTSKFGRIVDPLADKILVCGAFLCFAIIGRPKLFNLSQTALSVIHWSVLGILVAREAYVTILRHIAEARGVNFAATVSGKIKMFTQSFAIGTVVIKMAHVQTAAWGNWFTSITFAIMLTATIISGIRATKRKSWKAAQLENSQPADPS